MAKEELCSRFFFRGSEPGLHVERFILHHFEANLAQVVTVTLGEQAVFVRLGLGADEGGPAFLPEQFKDAFPFEGAREQRQPRRAGAEAEGAAEQRDGFAPARKFGGIGLRPGAQGIGALGGAGEA